MVSAHVKEESEAFNQAKIFWDCGSNVGMSRSRDGITVFSIGKHDRESLAACITKKGGEVAKV